MKFIPIFSLLLFVTQFAFAQIDRYEMPVDTLPLGGKDVQEKSIQMEGQDELIADMKDVNDSVSQYLLKNKNDLQQSAAQQQRVQSLELTLKNFNQTLSDLEKSEHDSTEMKVGYQQLDKLRAEFNSLKASQKVAK